MKLTNYTRDKILNAFRNQTFNGFAAYIALVKTSAPNAFGNGGTEISGGNYVRKTAAFNAPANDGDGRAIKNPLITYAAPTANWGDITGFYLMDAATGGNAVAFHAFPAPLTVKAGATVRFDAETLELKIS